MLAPSFVVMQTFGVIIKQEPMKNSQSSQQLASAIDIVITPDVKVVSEKQGQ